MSFFFSSLSPRSLFVFSPSLPLQYIVSFPLICSGYSSELSTGSNLGQFCMSRRGAEINSRVQIHTAVSKMGLPTVQ